MTSGDKRQDLPPADAPLAGGWWCPRRMPSEVSVAIKTTYTRDNNIIRWKLENMIRFHYYPPRRRCPFDASAQLLNCAVSHAIPRGILWCGLVGFVINFLRVYLSFRIPLLHFRGGSSMGLSEFDQPLLFQISAPG